MTKVNIVKIYRSKNFIILTNVSLEILKMPQKLSLECYITAQIAYIAGWMICMQPGTHLISLYYVDTFHRINQVVINLSLN